MFDEARIAIESESGRSTGTMPELWALKVRGPQGVAAGILRLSWPPPPELGLVEPLRRLCDAYAVGELG